MEKTINYSGKFCYMKPRFPDIDEDFVEGRTDMVPNVPMEV